MYDICDSFTVTKTINSHLQIGETNLNPFPHYWIRESQRRKCRAHKLGYLREVKVTKQLFVSFVIYVNQLLVIYTNKSFVVPINQLSYVINPFFMWVENR